MLYLTNAFSLNMLNEEARSQGVTLNIIPLSITDASERVLAAIKKDGMVNAIGHADTAKVVSTMLARYFYLGEALPDAQRISVTLAQGDCAIVAQLSGPRLPEGATALPEGAKIEWFLVVASGDEQKAIRVLHSLSSYAGGTPSGDAQGEWGLMHAIEDACRKAGVL